MIPRYHLILPLAATLRTAGHTNLASPSGARDTASFHAAYFERMWRDVIESAPFFACLCRSSLGHDAHIPEYPIYLLPAMPPQQDGRRSTYRVNADARARGSKVEMRSLSSAARHATRRSAAVVSLRRGLRWLILMLTLPPRHIARAMI